MSEIISRPYNKDGEDTWDRIFGKRALVCKGPATGIEYAEHDWVTNYSKSNPSTKRVCQRCGYEEKK